MPERHAFLATTALLPLILSFAQAHCGYWGLLFASGCLLAGTAACLWQRRHLRQAMTAQLQAFQREHAMLQQQLADEQRECSRLRVAKTQTEQAQHDWFVTLSQELRAPLNTVIGYSELFQEELGQMLGQEVRTDVYRLHKASQQLRRFLHDSHALADLEAGLLALCHETFDIVGIVDEVLLDLQPLLQERGHSCKLSLAAELGSMSADRPKMRRCLDNLLRHTALLSMQRTLVLQVACETTPAGEWLVIQAHAAAPHLQEAPTMTVPEQPEHPYGATLQRYRGTGLGLMLSERLCRLMGGALSLTGAGQEDIVGILRLPRWGPLPMPTTEQAPGSPPADAQAAETCQLPAPALAVAHPARTRTSAVHPTRL